MAVKNLSFPSDSEYCEEAESVRVKRESLVLYGFASVGRELFARLRSEGFQISAILDNNKSLQGKMHEGVRILPPESFCDTNAPVVICSNGFYSDIEKDLKSRGFKRILPFYFAFFGKPVDENNIYFFDTAVYSDKKLAKRYADKNELFFKTIDLTITEKCTLRCKSCCNRMQYFKNPRHADFNTLSRAADVFLNTIDGCTKIHILGGEPFCNPDLPRYIEAILLHDNFDYIEIFTNATVIPDKTTLSVLRESNAMVKIADYGVSIQKTDEICALLRDEKINAWIVRYDGWPSVNSPGFYDRSDEENKLLFEKCAIANIWTLNDDRLRRCPAAAQAAKLRALPASSDESVALDAASGREKLREEINKLRSLPFIKACNYCSTLAYTRSLPIKAGEQCPNPLPYTIYE